MTNFRFGDLLRYPYEQDPKRLFLFMYVGRWPGQPEYLAVMNLTKNDDTWEVGELVEGGVEEFELAKEVMTADGVREAWLMGIDHTILPLNV